MNKIINSVTSILHSNSDSNSDKNSDVKYDLDSKNFVLNTMSHLHLENLKYGIGIDTTILPKDFDKWTLVLCSELSCNKYVKFEEYVSEVVIESWTDNIFMEIGGTRYEFAKGRYFFPIFKSVHDVKIKYTENIKIYAGPKDEYGLRPYLTNMWSLAALIGVVFYLNLKLSSQDELNNKKHLTLMHGMYGYGYFSYELITSDEFYGILIRKQITHKKAKCFFARYHTNKLIYKPIDKLIDTYKQDNIMKNIIEKIENNLIE